MSQTTPYQPVLLRLLHSVIALLVFAALITGFMVYDRFDKRFGTLNLPIVPNTQGYSWHDRFNIFGSLTTVRFILLSYWLTAISSVPIPRSAQRV